MSPTQWAGLILLSLIWGSSFLFVELAVDHASAFMIVFLRVCLAGAALILFCLAKGIRIPLDRDRLSQYAILALLSHALPFTALTWSQGTITASLASIYNAMTPLFTVLVAHVLLADERATALKLAGVLTGFTGVAVLIGGDIGTLSSGSLWAQLAALSAALFYAFSFVYARKLSGIPPAGIAAATLSIASVYMLPLTFLNGGTWSTGIEPGGLAAIVTLALFCTAFAYIIYYWLIARAGATNASLVTFLIPPSAIGLGMIFLGETLGLHQVAGLCLIVFGLILVDGKLVRRIRRRPV